MESVREHIEALVAEAGSYQKLADRLEITRQTIFNVKNGGWVSKDVADKLGLTLNPAVIPEDKTAIKEFIHSRLAEAAVKLDRIVAEDISKETGVHPDFYSTRVPCKHKELCEDGEYYSCALEAGHKGKCIRGNRIEV